MRFVEVVEALGVEQAPPTKILELLGAAGVGLTPQAISSHLQEYRRARSQANPAAAVPFGGPVVPTGLPAGFPLGAFPLPGAPGFPGQPPRPVGVPPMLPGGFLPPPGVGGFPLLPYALPMQGMPGQCWMPPPYNMPPGMLSSRTVLIGRSGSLISLWLGSLLSLLTPCTCSLSTV